MFALSLLNFFLVFVNIWLIMVLLFALLGGWGLSSVWGWMNDKVILRERPKMKPTYSSDDCLVFSPKLQII